MIDIDKLDSEVLTHILKNMRYEPDSDEGVARVAGMNLHEAFQRWCWWNGFLGSWSEAISKAYESIKSSEIDTDED